MEDAMNKTVLLDPADTVLRLRTSGQRPASQRGLSLD
jgi:hypothetical protein